MKTFIFSLMIFISAVRTTASADCLYESDNYIPDQVNCFINAFAERQKQTHNLILATKEGETCCYFIDCCFQNTGCCLEKIALMFDYFGVVDLPQARQLTLGLVTSFLQEINVQEKLKCFFCTFPLGLDQISIHIRMRNDCEFKYPYLGNIASISMIDGMITYGTINSYTYQVDVLRRETYDQALQLSAPR